MVVMPSTVKLTSLTMVLAEDVELLPPAEDADDEDDVLDVEEESEDSLPVVVVWAVVVWAAVV